MVKFSGLYDSRYLRILAIYYIIEEQVEIYVFLSNFYHEFI